jgi:type IV pilus assembly protein PilB
MLARSQRVLVERLHELGSLDEIQMKKLLASEGLSGKDIDKILVDEYKVRPIPLLLAKAQAYNLTPFNLQNFRISDNCFEHLEVEFCKQNRIIPLGMVGSYLCIATADPLNPSLRAKIEGETKKPFYFVLVDREELEVTYDESKRGGSGQSVHFGDVVQSLGLEFEIDAENIDEEDLEDEESAPIVLLTNKIIEDAYFSGASDIHIEPLEKNTRVRVRVDGILKERLNIPNTVCRGIISRLKVMCNLDITENRRPQDGRIIFKFYNRKGIDVDLRISTCPMANGEGCVMRLLDKSKSTLPLPELGFTKDNLDRYRKLIKQPHGMVLHCGPTGSGKSMTLYSALNEINRPDVCIRTAEDPIEYTLPGIIQVQMNRKIGVSFAEILRSFLRQDPDIILVGEIRDRETAQIGVEAALTGHLLFSTVHTNDAPYTISRLLDLEIEPFMISSALICAVAQRLLRRLCETCKHEYTPEGAEQQILERSIHWSGPIYKANDVGCPNCGQSGYRGRTGIHEILENNEELTSAINRGSDAAILKAIGLRSGMKTLHQDSMLKVKLGFTSIEEAVITIPPDREDVDEILRMKSVPLDKEGLLPRIQPEAALATAEIASGAG